MSHNFQSNRYEILDMYCTKNEIEVANRVIEAERVTFTVKAGTSFYNVAKAVFCVALTDRLFAVYAYTGEIGTSGSPNCELLATYSK